MAERIRLGELLVEMRLLTREQLEQALATQKTDGRRLGEILVHLRMVSESQLTQVLSQQLSVPWVALQHIDFSRQLLNLVPAETAQKYGVVPIYVRRARNRQETLYVAMEDPSDEEPLREIAAHANLPVRAMIAPPTDIRGAIRAYYLGLPPEEDVGDVEVVEAAPPPPERVPSAPPRRPSAQPAAAVSSAAAAPNAGVVAPPPPAVAVVDLRAPAVSSLEAPPESVPHAPSPSGPDSEENAPESGPVEPRAIRAPRGRAANAPRMVQITMLDGTVINLPAADTLKRRGHESRAPSVDLTARDLVEALRAQSVGADASEVLGEGVSWESMFAALLSVLLKKHLISDWEFVRELRRG